MSRRWTIVFWIATVATVAPLFAAEYLPFTDLPEHLAVMSALRHWSDPAFRVQEHYALALGQSQYLVYHFAGALLSHLTGDVESANRLLMAAAGIGFPLSFRALLRALGRDERLALFACPLFWSRPLVIGFLPFVASIPVLLGTLATWARTLRAPTLRRRLLLTTLAIFTFYVHASAFVMLALSAASMAVVERIGREGSWRDRARGSLTALRDLVWLAPAVVIAAVWSSLGRLGLEAETASGPPVVSRMSLPRTVRAFGLWAHDVWWTHVDEICAVAFWVAFIALLIAGVRSEGRDRGERDLTFVPFLCAGALYLLLPFQVDAGYMLNVRMAPVLALFAVLAVQPVSGRAATGPLILVFAASLVTSINAIVEIRSAAANELGDATALLDRIRPGARVMSLIFNPTSKHTHFPPWLYLGSYHRVRKGGLAAYSFSEMKHWPLHYVPENAPPPKRRLWVFHPCTFRNAIDGEYYDYVLTYGDVDPFRDEPPGPVFRKVAESKAFSLWEKTPGARFPPWDQEDPGPCP